MNHILVPTDFSKNAHSALEYAIQLYKDDKGIIHLIHSIEERASQLTSRVDIGNTDEVMAELYRESDEQLFELRNEIRRKYPDLQLKFECVSTSLSIQKSILRYGKNHDIDLVVMGTQGHTNAGNVILGSNTVRVIKNIEHIAVLIIPVGFAFKVPARIAFATAFKREYTLAELKPMLNFAREFDSEITIMHIKEDSHISDLQSMNLDRLLELLKGYTTTVSWLAGDNKKAKSITDFLEEKDFDMLAMIFYKHNFLAQLFRESVVKKIGKKPRIPYLVIPSLA